MNPELERGYPLAWPDGRPRLTERKPALFRDGGSRLTLTKSTRRLHQQVEAMTPTGQPWRVTGMTLSTNIRFTASGGRDMNVSRRDPADPGVAFYFTFDKQPHVLACDRWDAVPDNIAAIAAHIEALRGQERWGVADLRQAFAGHVALPPPEQWWQVLGLSKTASRAEVEAAYRDLARAAHPDTGGSDAAMSRLNAARDAARNRP